MLHILWLILQILLFAVLILLGLAVVLVLLVLFVPVRYKVYAEKQDNFICKIKATWMGFVFCFKARYDADGFVYWLRSFGGTLVSNEDGFTGETDTEAEASREEKEAVKLAKKEEKERKKESALEKKKQKQEKKEQRKSKKNKKNEPPAETETALYDETEEAVDTQAADETAREEHREFAKDDTEFTKQPETIFTKIGKKLDKIVITIKNKTSAFVNKLRKLKTKAEQYKKFITANSTKQSLAVVKLYLIKLLKHMNPTKINGRVTYGSGDPASTGEQLGRLSMLLPLFADKVDITPDFSQKILLGDIFIKGRVRVYNILYCGLKVYFNKYVKFSIAYFKKISGGTK